MSNLGPLGPLGLFVFCVCFFFWGGGGGGGRQNGTLGIFCDLSDYRQFTWNMDLSLFLKTAMKLAANIW